MTEMHIPIAEVEREVRIQEDTGGLTIEGDERLFSLEEMGFCVELKELDSFIYNVEFDNGLIEHELDYILVGRYNGSVKFNSNEVDSWKWMSLDNIIDDIKAIPENYTEWFKIIMNNYYYQLKKI